MKWTVCGALLFCLAFPPCSPSAAAQSAASYEALIQQGKAQLQAQHADQALATGEQAIKLDAKNWEGYALAGGALMNLKRYDEAISRLTEAMDRAPQDKQAGLSELRKQCFAAESGNSALTSTPPVPATSSSTPEATTTQAEIVLWKSIENSTNAGDFQDYLSQYPSGAFAALAKSRLDEPTWKSIEASDSPADFQSYLAQFPQGKYAALATARLKSVSALAGVGTKLQVQLAWLTQEVAANSKTQFFFLYPPKGGGWSAFVPVSPKPNFNNPKGPSGIIVQTINGLNGCTLSVHEHADYPDNPAFYEWVVDTTLAISLTQLDVDQIRALDVTDQRDVNPYDGLNGWLVALSPIPGTKAISYSKQVLTGKNLSQSSSGSGSWPDYAIVVNDATAAPKAADLLRQMAQACKAAESGTVAGNLTAAPESGNGQPAAPTPPWDRRNKE